MLKSSCNRFGPGGHDCTHSMTHFRQNLSEQHRIERGIFDNADATLNHDRLDCRQATRLHQVCFDPSLVARLRVQALFAAPRHSPILVS